MKLDIENFAQTINVPCPVPDITMGLTARLPSWAYGQLQADLAPGAERDTTCIAMSNCLVIPDDQIGESMQIAYSWRLVWPEALEVIRKDKRVADSLGRTLSCEWRGALQGALRVAKNDKRFQPFAGVSVFVENTVRAQEGKLVVGRLNMLCRTEYPAELVEVGAYRKMDIPLMKHKTNARKKK